MKKVLIARVLALLVTLTVAVPVIAYDSGSAQEPAQAEDASRRIQVTPGMKMKTKGVLLRQDGDGFIMRDMMGSELRVTYAANTKIEEKKSNPFRGAKKYTPAQLIRGLNLEVEGRGGSSGALAAEKIKFSDDDLRVAMTVDSQVVPLENRVAQTEQNAQRLSGQVDELAQVANLARGGAAAAQETADAAVDGVNRTNDRISTLDDYDVKQTTTIHFKVGSAVLSDDAKTQLDDLAAQAKSERGFVIEVRGFASSDGSENFNRRLSQRRSEGVMRYLAETHDIPLRRITLPFGYGEAMPAADNSTLEGRRENRRAEVRILVSRGLTTPVNVNRPVSSTRQ